MPITFDLLCKIHPFVNFLSSNDIVFWSAITCGHFLLLRASEFTVNGTEPFDPSRHLTLSDVNSHQSPTGEHYWTVRLKQSKTDQRREGVTLYMSHTNHVVCPACAMKSNAALQQSRPRTPKDSPLFLLEHQQVLTRQHLVTFVSHLLRLVGIDPTAYSGHSFRIGGATSASLAGLKDYEIQMLGRWKSDCYKTYVRSPLNVLLQVPQRIAKTASITYQYANPYYQNTQDY